MFYLEGKGMFPQSSMGLRGSHGSAPALNTLNPPVQCLVKTETPGSCSEGNRLSCPPWQGVRRGLTGTQQFGSFLDAFKNWLGSSLDWNQMERKKSKRIPSKAGRLGSSWPLAGACVHEALRAEIHHLCGMGGAAARLTAMSSHGDGSVREMCPSPSCRPPRQSLLVSAERTVPVAETASCSGAGASRSWGVMQAAAFQFLHRPMD